MAKLMLVEDDNNLREIYEARLQAEGYEIVSAKDGEEALVVAKKEKPDLIISDVMMPKISGFEMLDILRNTDGLKEVKVIMLTALGQNDDQQRAGKLGANRYLVKSQVTLEDIVKAAHELLEDGEGAGNDSSAPAAEPSAAAPSQSDTPASPPPAPEPPAAPAVAPEPVAAAPPSEPPAAPMPAPQPSSPAPAPASPAAEPQPQQKPSTTTIPVVSAPPDDTANTTPSTATQAAAQTTQTAQSTDQEEAAAKEQIEDFVAGATEEPTKPTAPPQAQVQATQSAPTAAPATPQATPADTDAAAAQAAENSANDDKLVEEAAQALVNSTKNTATGGNTAPANDKPAPASTEEPAAAPQAQPTPASTAAPIPSATPAASGSTTPAPQANPSQPQGTDAPASKLASRGEKVITPLNDKPKKDLNTLLAEESNKAAANDNAPATPPAPNPAPPANTNNPPDPNNIAL